MAKRAARNGNGPGEGKSVKTNQNKKVEEIAGNLAQLHKLQGTLLANLQKTIGQS